MESFSRFANRFERSINRASSDRIGSDRSSTDRSSMDRARSDRDYSERRRAANMVTLDQIKETVTNANENQLDIIQDFFDDDRIDREASEKEILRVVDSNAKLLNKSYRLISDFKSEWDDEEKIDYKELSEANKEEILKAVFSNAEILKLLKEELIEKKNTDEEEKLLSVSEAEKLFTDMEDHVHKENVKCYRNVQAVIVEQDGQTYGKIKKGFSAVKALVVITMLIGAANLGIIICQLLHIL